MIRAALLCLAMTGTAQAGCNDDGAPCSVPLGDYHLALPYKDALPDSDAPIPVLIFFHGAGGNGKSITSSQAFLKRGYAIIGPNGLKRPGSRFGSSWSFHPERSELRDESGFLREIITDAVANHNIDPDKILIGGFSIGGSMASYLACDDPTLAKAFAPVAGGFWRPHPKMGSCAGPVNLLHTHGWKDQTVPLEGRPLGGGQIYQGDIFVTLQIWREENGCANMRADEFDTTGPFWRRMWTSCEAGSLEFALHQGGHGIPKGWSAMAMDWFESLP